LGNWEYLKIEFTWKLFTLRLGPELEWV